MRKLFLVLALLVVVAVSAVPAFAQDERPTILDWLTNDADGRFTTLVAAIEAAGLTDTVAGLEDATVLAPTNDAFAATLEAAGLDAADLLANPELLTSVLTSHILPGTYFFRELTGSPALPTVADGEVQFDLTDGVFTVNGVNISDVDNIASNGIVHVIDGVILPADLTAAPAEVTEEAPAEAVVDARPSILDWLTNDADARFTTLLMAVQAAGLTDTVASLEDVTVLAPTNDAFVAAMEASGLSAGDVMANPELLTTILTSHILPGTYFFRELTGGPALPTVAGTEVQFDLTDGVFTVNGVNISDVDNIASNGIVHVLDGVILPSQLLPQIQPTVEPTEEPVVEEPADIRPSIVEWLTNDADARFTTLLAAVEAAGVGPAFAGLDGVTLLAPTNDAFAAALEGLGVTAEDVLGNPALLGQILRYHVIPGEYFFRELTGGPSLPTQAGSNVQFNLTDGVFTVNNVNISDVDNVASNGVVHVIDGVLLPRSAASAFPAHVRVAHLAADGPNVDVYQNFVLALSDVPFGTISEWMTIPAGTYNINVVPAGASPSESVIGPADLTFAPNTWTTVAATGTVAAGTLGPQVIVEDFGPLADGQARLTVFHAIEGAPAVNIVANNSTIISNLAYPGTVNDNDGVYTLDIAAGTYSVQVTTTDGAALLDLGEVTLDAGNAYFVVASGTLDNPGVTITSSAVPAQ